LAPQTGDFEIEDPQLLLNLVTQNDMETKMDIHMLYGILMENQEYKRKKERKEKHNEMPTG
jgi:hypothetical protein